MKLPRRGSYWVPEQPGPIKTNGVRIQNSDPAITNGLRNKSKGEADPDSNRIPKVDFKKKNTQRPIMLLKPLIGWRLPPLPLETNGLWNQTSKRMKIGPEICFFSVLSFVFVSLYFQSFLWGASDILLQRRVKCKPKLFLTWSLPHTSFFLKH